MSLRTRLRLWAAQYTYILNGPLAFSLILACSEWTHFGHSVTALPTAFWNINAISFNIAEDFVFQFTFRCISSLLKSPKCIDVFDTTWRTWIAKLVLLGQILCSIYNHWEKTTKYIHISSFLMSGLRYLTDHFINSCCTVFQHLFPKVFQMWMSMI